MLAGTLAQNADVQLDVRAPLTAYESFVIVAHRGMRSHAPENTIPAFTSALQHGFPHMELDVMLSKDGECVVFHDDDLHRTTNGAGALCEATLTELRELDAGSWFSNEFKGTRIPTLAETLTMVGKQAHLHLEMKTEQHGLPSAVAQELALHHQPSWSSQQDAADSTGDDASTADASAWAAPGLTITSFHLSQLAQSMKVLPEVRHAWLVQELTHDVLSAAYSAGIAQLCPRANAVTAASVAAAREAGFTVRAWGVKTPEMMVHLAEVGVQGGTADWPLQARNALQQAGASARSSQPTA